MVTENVKGEKMVEFVKAFDHYHHKFFSSLVKLQNDLNLKFRSKFNHGFTNHGYVHCATLKSFMAKIAHEARDNQFLFQNVQDEIFEVFKTFKNKMKFTRAGC